MCFHLGLLPNTPLVRKLGQNRPGSEGGEGGWGTLPYKNDMGARRQF